MNEESDFDQFCEDFVSPRLSTSELDALKERVRLGSDSQLRQLVKEAELYRWLMPLLLERAEQVATSSDDQFIKLARFLVRGEGGIGSA